ncbi:MAG: Mechanosensitive ion channel-like protein [uncultured Campylobacterales bacterium]|uniref:Mechanosensitive ion channel-like protein n=1 Tax=uncultured Campylobacterales bacterium TaxID=352960 RepID=A0A6S6SZC9_9BACT|nr:MAG: Mechanosensitive ion channel-like protein [uncultured Campylobacterales bacterium]
MKKIFLLCVFSLVLFAEGNSSIMQNIEKWFFLDDIVAFLEISLFEYKGNSFTLWSISKIIIIFLIGFFAGWLFKFKIIKSDRIGRRISSSTRTLVANLGYYIIIFWTFMIALKAMGLSLSSLTVVAGALSVGIGFGLQNIVSNFISGIILMFEKSIQVGHYLELDNGVRGIVSDIKMRATLITTKDNVDILVPNSEFIQKSVTNMTLGDSTMRVHIPFGVAYGTDMDFVKKVIFEGIDNNDSLPHIKKSSIRKTDVWMVGMNSSSVDFELVVWVKDDDTKSTGSTKSTYLMAVYKILVNNKITIPFPQLDLNVKEMPKGI